MPRARRLIRAQRPYELILRVEYGLPFATLSLIKLIIEGIIARVQRDNKVIICHYLWMGNHVHMIIIARDTQQCVFFYQEIQKKITDSMKRLLGKHKLTLWEGDPVLAEILDPDALIERIAYIYANPANADLVESIDDYPGLSTWRDFLEIGCNYDCVLSKEVPWIQLPSIKTLSSLSISKIEDSLITSRLKSSAKMNHTLTIEPNAWFKCFGIHQSETKYYLERVINSVRKRQQDAQLRRRINNKYVLGKKELCSQSIFKQHTPKKRDRRIYIISSVTELRIAFINEMKDFCFKCKECYQKWKYGMHSVIWPPGAFRPPGFPLATALATSLNH